MTPNQLLAACHAGDGGIGWEIEKSLRLRGSNLASLTKVFPLNTDTNAYKKTYSTWIKRGKLGSAQAIMTNGMSAPYNWFIGFTASDQLQLYGASNSVVVCDKRTTMVFRDPSAWYHILVAIDVTSPIAEERARLYVNGVRVTAFSTNSNPALNDAYAMGYLSAVSGAYTAVIGGYNYAAGYNLEGYLAEIHVVDGQALTPSYFGQWSQESGQWVPIRYTGVYGNNGFYLDFKDNSALTNLGYDKSGLANHWTPNNFSLTAGHLYDSMLDTPSNNFTVINPLNNFNTNVAATLLSNGNIIVNSAAAANAYSTRSGTLAVNSGKWYFEVKALVVQAAAATNFSMGWTAPNTSSVYPTTNVTLNNGTASGTLYKNSVSQGVVSGIAANDIIGIALDLDNLTCAFYKNGTQLGSTITGLTAGTWQPIVTAISDPSSLGTQCAVNFGQQAFIYTPPTGFKSLCSKNLPTPSIKRGETGFDVATWTGNGGNIQVGEYQFPRPSYLIDKSLRFKGVNSYLSRTPGAAGNRQKWTASAWVKGSGALLCAGTIVNGVSGNYNEISVNTTSIRTWHYNGTVDDYYVSSRGINDANWHHILVKVDTTLATANDRMQIWIDGIRQTAVTNAPPAQNTITQVAAATPHNVGRRVADAFGGAGWNYFNGYIAEMHVIDGQALDPSSFGEFDINGYWIPKAYAGTYGANGFYLDFEDTSAVANLGFDKSGLGNNWSVNNFSLTAGVNYDSMDDSPTANFAVLDAIYKGSGATIGNGGLSWTLSANPALALLTQAVKNGKYYLEVFNPSALASIAHCILTGDFNTVSVSGGTSVAAGMWEIYDNNIGIHYSIDGAAFVSPGLATRFLPSGTVQIAIDASEGKFWIGRNNVWYDSNWGTTGDPSTGVNPTWSISPTRGPFRYGVNAANAGTVHVNTGQRPFTYAPPTGFKTLSIPNIAEYTEDLESPDLVWIKCRNAAQNHMLFDSVRGATKYLSSNLTAAEATDVNSLISFNKNGFYLGNNANVNTLNNTYVAWMWKANQTQVANNDGTIASQVKVNQALGFSVVKYTGNGSANASVGHGLGIKPNIAIGMGITQVGNKPLIYDLVDGSLDYLYLNSTQAAANATQPVFTSTVINVQLAAGDNNNGIEYLWYCFAEIGGFSKFGKYTGNGSADGPFIFTGMKPRFIMIKRIDAVNDWLILDTTRSDINNGSTRRDLAPNLAGAELTDAYPTDILSNGFKLRNVGNGYNVSSATYIFAAFAECPMKYSTAR